MSLGFQPGEARSKLAQGTMKSKCVHTPVSSRVCEHGTKCCDVKHDQDVNWECIKKRLDRGNDIIGPVFGDEEAYAFSHVDREWLVKKVEELEHTIYALEADEYDRIHFSD